jgi:hypothetical protein
LAALAAAEAMLQRWLDLQQESNRLDLASQAATRRKTAAKQAAEAEDRAFRDLIDLHYTTDPQVRMPLLLPLPKPPKRRSRGSAADDPTAQPADDAAGEPPVDQPDQAPDETDETDETTESTETAETNGAKAPAKKKRRRPPRSTAAYLARWRSRFMNVEKLNDDHQALLARFGWPLSRRQTVAGLIEAYAEADYDQRNHIKDYRVTLQATKAAERAIRDWYRLAAGLCDPAIRRAAPDNYQELLDLLGLSA